MEPTSARASSSSCRRCRSVGCGRRSVSHSSSAELAGVRVLFVDDQPDARDLAQVIFANAGAEATITSSRIEALEALERMPVDIVVADIGMPEVDGYALIAEIRRRDALASATRRRSPRPRIAARTLRPRARGGIRRLPQEADGRGDADVDRRRRHAQPRALAVNRRSACPGALPVPGAARDSSRVRWHRRRT